MAQDQSWGPGLDRDLWTHILADAGDNIAPHAERHRELIERDDRRVTAALFQAADVPTHF
jgi:hypothetical protein